MKKFKTSASMAFLILVAVVMLFPIYWLFVSSAKTSGELFGGNALLPPSHVVLGGNYDVLTGYESGAFWLWFRNSMIYAFGTAAVGTYVCAMTGYALAKLSFPGKKAILGFVLGGLMVPTTVLIIPIFIMEHDLRLTNTFAGVILPLVVSPFGVYFMWAFSADGVSRSLIDSGRVDGAGEIRIFHRIVLPILVPALVTLFLILFIGTWNNYFLPLVLLHQGSLFPLTVGLATILSLGQQGLGVSSYSALLLGAVISVLPMLVLFPFLQKYVARGLTFGSTTGE
jgi:multiple sugar transport system permease protein